MKYAGEAKQPLSEIRPVGSVTSEKDRGQQKEEADDSRRVALRGARCPGRSWTVA